MIKIMNCFILVTSYKR